MTELPGREVIGNRQPDRAGMSPETRTVANELALSAQARQVPTVRRSVALTVRRWPDKW
jgi:hypothetical protein